MEYSTYMSYCPSFRPGCVLMDREGVEVRKTAKNKRGQYPAILTEQALSIKDLLYRERKDTIFYRGTASNRTRVKCHLHRSSILTAQVSVQVAGSHSHIVNMDVGFIYASSAISNYFRFPCDLRY